MVRRERTLRVIASILLLAMVTLLVGRAVHVHHHATRCCEHTDSVEQSHSDGDSNDRECEHHRCGICNLSLFQFIPTSSGDIFGFISIISVIFTLYRVGVVTTPIRLRNGRAPPKIIL